MALTALQEEEKAELAHLHCLTLEGVCHLVRRGRGHQMPTPCLWAPWAQESWVLGPHSLYYLVCSILLQQQELD